MQWIKCSKSFPPDWMEVVLRQISTKKVIKEEDVFCADGECFKMEEMEEGERKRIYFDDVEWLDESEHSFSINDMKEAYEEGRRVGEQEGKYGTSPSSFSSFMKNEYNIDIN